MMQGDVEIPSHASAPTSGNGSSGVPANRDESSIGSASSASSYKDESDNDLSVISGAALITADCMGTGVLALPADMRVLGMAFGLTFLVLNLPINWYAGTILSKAATHVERRLGEAQVSEANDDWDAGDSDEEGDDDATGVESGERNKTRGRSKKRSGYSSVGKTAAASNASNVEAEFDDDDAAAEADSERSSWEVGNDDRGHPGAAVSQQRRGHSAHQHSRFHTYDFLGMTSALFEHPAFLNSSASVRTWPSKLVAATFYTNIFLVLGSYILVMSRAVAAIVGEENICLPTAGIIASVLMYALSQIRTMANLGRSASLISLTALFIVVVQCLASIERGDEEVEIEADDDEAENAKEAAAGETSLMRQLSALASVGFAVGSQKLLLNIRHEMAERERDTPRALGVALLAFGGAYIGVCILAGPNPPAFLFDAIGAGPARRFAGFLLWIHVAVSFAINSQALTSSIDRVGFHRVRLWGLNERHRMRWAFLTLLIALSSYTVANAIPFFKDLVALIGALTSVPLTLLLPAVLHRVVMQVSVCKVSSRHDVGSFLLVVFALAFMACGLVGVFDSIEMDWASKGQPFACH